MVDKVTYADILKMIRGTSITLINEDIHRVLAGKAFITKKVVLHFHPDLDAMAAYWLARQLPGTFIGIETAPIEFWPQGPPPDGRDAFEHEREGTICFDVGQGPFDHHPHGKDLKKCALDLVADFVGASNFRPLQQILGYIRMHDLEGPTVLSRSLREMGIAEETVSRAMLLETNSLVSVISHMQHKLTDSLQLVNWVCGQLSSAFQSQLYFWTVLDLEFKEKALVIPVSDGSRIYKVTVIDSNLRRIGSFTRTDEGGFCAVCIHRMPKTGFVFISGTLESAQNIEIAKFLRIWEMQKRGISLPFYWEELTQSTMPACPSWYLPLDIHGNVYIIMNGGDKATAVEPTVLTLEDIFQAVRWGIDERILHESCPGDHCLGLACGFYPFGLNRCHRIRQQSN